MIPDSFIEELKARTDIEQIVAPYTSLKRTGRTLSGLCPFHSEKTPSFVVYPENGSFYCFGCTAGGDVVTFVRKIENLDYVEAIRFLADKAGMALPEDGAEDASADLRRTIFEINRAAARHFHSRLAQPEGKIALQYLRSRGVTDKTIRRFGIGWADDSWDMLKRRLLSQGFEELHLIEAAVIRRGRQNSYDIFRGRVMFPIIDTAGKVVGFGGRSIGDAAPKYLNSSDTPVFKKSRGLYALNFAKAQRGGRIILTEGYMDTIALNQAGFGETVATLGTALTGEQARLLARYAGEVVIAYDSDEAGQNATRKAAERLTGTGVQVRVAWLEGAKDPDEYIKKFGSERFSRLLKASKTAASHEIGMMMAKYDLDSDDGRVAFLREFCPAMARLPSFVEADVHIGRAAQTLRVSREAIAAQVDALRKKAWRAERKKFDASLKLFTHSSPEAGRDPERAANLRCALAEDKLITILLKNPDIAPALERTITPEQFVTEKNKEIFRVVMSRIKSGRGTELMDLSGELDSRQMAWISYLLASDGAKCLTAGDAGQCVKTILSKQSQVSPEQLGAMSEDELAEYVKTIALNKNAGGHDGGGTGKERG